MTFCPLSVRLSAILAVFLLLAAVFPAGAESEVRANLELYTSAYRGRNDWYFTGTGMADIRFASTGNRNMRAEAAVEFYPIDLSGGSSVSSVPSMSLKRLWFKANFPNWRLTAGKTKLGWGNGFVFNSGDILFGSLTPYLDFTQSTIRDDTAFLTAFNIPTGRFSYFEGVILPPSIIYDGSSLEIQPVAGTSGGLRYFFRVGGWRLETGYLYKGDAKVSADLLGHRPYFSFHGHLGVDMYGAVSLAGGYDADADIHRDNWDEISRTFNFSLGFFHQFQIGYDSTLMLRFETLVMPWQNWSAKDFEDVVYGDAGYYGITLYPEITWTMRNTWFVGVQSIISPVDASAQITANVGWNVFQGFTLIGYFVVNAGDDNSLFAWDRSGNWPQYADGSTDWYSYEFNGINITLGARYSY